MRKCFLQSGKEVDMLDLKRGDIFRLEGDDLCPKGYYLAINDAKPCEPSGNAEVSAEPC